MQQEEERQRLCTILEKLSQPEERVTQTTSPQEVKLIGEFEELMLAEPDYSDLRSPFEGYALEAPERDKCY